MNEVSKMVPSERKTREMAENKGITGEKLMKNDEKLTFFMHSTRAEPVKCPVSKRCRISENVGNDKEN